LEIIEGGTHRFNDHLEEIAALAVKWYGENFE